MALAERHTAALRLELRATNTSRMDTQARYSRLTRSMQRKGPCASSSAMPAKRSMSTEDTQSAVLCRNLPFFGAAAGALLAPLTTVVVVTSTTVELISAALVVMLNCTLSPPSTRLELVTTSAAAVAAAVLALLAVPMLRPVMQMKSAWMAHSTPHSSAMLISLPMSRESSLSPLYTE